MLLDLDMPRLGGLDVLKRLPTVKQAEDIPVIVMTAHGSIQAAVDAMKEGAYDFLTKPLDKDHLLIGDPKSLGTRFAQATGGLSQVGSRQPVRLDRRE